MPAKERFSFLQFIKIRIFEKNWLCLILIYAFILRLPSLFEPLVYGDEGIYMTLGLAIRRGLIPYLQIHDNKPPLVYLLAAVAHNFQNYRLLLMLWSLATIFVFEKLVERLAG